MWRGSSVGTSGKVRTSAAGWTETCLPAFEGRLLPIDVAVARRAAGLHVPDPRSERDVLIAASALEQGMTVVTRNLSDFASLGVELRRPLDGLTRTGS